MRIISKQKDYYDAAMAEGQDRSLVFVRHQEEWNTAYRTVEVPPLLQPFMDVNARVNPRHVQFTRPMPDVMEVNTSFGLIWFAGRLYPFAGTRARRLGEIVTPPHKFAYTLADLVQHLAEYDCKLPDKKKRRGVLWGERPSFEKFFELSGSRELEAIAYERNIPVASAFEHTVRLNGRLKDYEFIRRLDPYQAYQELSMFLGNLAAPDRVPVHVADKDRIQQHGFDEWSFRKMPEAR